MTWRGKLWKHEAVFVLKTLSNRSLCTLSLGSSITRLFVLYVFVGALRTLTYTHAHKRKLTHTHARTHTLTHTHTHARTHSHTHTHAAQETDRQTEAARDRDGQTSSQTDRQSDRQTADRQTKRSLSPNEIWMWLFDFFSGWKSRHKLFLCWFAQTD